ncbi:hypothetical protein BH09SUM1_BH09SUM1_04040 [soil metagenome]
MKNQYLCDINDYVKYGLLRALADGGKFPITVAWMLTQDDGGNDGKKRCYLKDAKKHRGHDGELFDCLAKLTTHEAAHVGHVRESGIIPGARYFADLVIDEREHRAAWLDNLWRFANGSRLVFFDPDNGFEVKSVKAGRKNSHKYLYWNEFAEAWKRGYSVLVYQHFPRVGRDEYLKGIADQVLYVAPTAEVISVSSSTVGYILAMQPRDAVRLKTAIEGVAISWEGKVLVRRDH